MENQRYKLEVTYQEGDGQEIDEKYMDNPKWAMAAAIAEEKWAGTIAVLLTDTETGEVLYPECQGCAPLEATAG